MTTDIQRINEMIEKVRFVIEDENHNVIGVVEEKETEGETTKQLILSVVEHLTILKQPVVFVRYRLFVISTVVHIARHSVAVDDAYISFGEYVSERCKSLVLSMYRTRELETQKPS